jgi:hypothetical protein
MYRNFDKRTATINVSKEQIRVPKKDGTSELVDGINVYITSDLPNQNCHKSQLYINQKAFANEVDACWRSVKEISNKIISLQVHFEEVDYYDNMTNMYSTPVFQIKKGQRVVHINEREHGSIPKDWEIALNAKFENCQRVAPITGLIEKVLGPYFTTAMANDFEKAIRPLLQGKVNSVNYNLSNE